jgi:5-methylcytosine-specific restriction endonuclease McrA
MDSFVGKVVGKGPVRPTMPVAEFAATFGISTKEARRVLGPLGLMLGQRVVLSAKLWRTLETGVPRVEHACCGLSPTAVLALLKAIEDLLSRIEPSRQALPATTRRAVLERDGSRCRYCGKRIPKGLVTIDHVMPVSQGGGDDTDNLVVACRSCNYSKGSNPPCGWEWLPKQSTVRCTCSACN